MKNKKNIYKTNIKTPIGEMIACATDKGLCVLQFISVLDKNSSLHKLIKQNIIIEEPNDHLIQIKSELEDYFRGGLQEEFKTPIDFIGTDFQISVWNELLKIPYGETITYAEQAKRVGNPKAMRAVANANGKNKVAIIVPCHRVIGSNGKLTGFASGLDNKKYLLDLEQD